MRGFDSTLPIALYIAAGSVLTLVATALLADEGRAEIARDFENVVEEGIPETAKASAGKVAVT